MPADAPVTIASGRDEDCGWCDMGSEKSKGNAAPLTGSRCQFVQSHPPPHGRKIRLMVGVGDGLLCRHDDAGECELVSSAHQHSAYHIRELSRTEACRHTSPAGHPRGSPCTKGRRPGCSRVRLLMARREARGCAIRKAGAVVLAADRPSLCFTPTLEALEIQSIRGPVNPVFMA
jgi:hypothetical protein